MRGLYAAKPWYTAQLRGVVRQAQRRRISPDVFTIAGVGAAVAAGAAIWQGWWIAAAVLLSARLAGSNLDGAVARARSVARPWGFVVNEMGDRASDLAMFGGLCMLANKQPPGGLALPLALIATVSASLPTFAALAAAGAGSARSNGGPVGKTERCALVVVATGWPASIPVVCVIVIAGSLATTALRLHAAHRELQPTAATP